MTYSGFLVAGFPSPVFEPSIQLLSGSPKEGMKILLFLTEGSFHLSYQLQERGKLRYRDGEVPSVDFTHVDKC